MNKPPLELRRIRDFGQCIADSFRFLKENFKPLTRSVLAICGIFILASFITTYLQYSQMFNGIEERSAPLQTRFGFSYFANLIALSLAYFALFTTINAYVALALNKKNEKPVLAEVWAYVTYYFWRVAGAFILGYIVLVLGFVLCLVPGIWMFPIFTMIFPVIMIENASFGYAVERSRFLVKDNWWPTFGVIVVSGIIGTIPGYFIGIIIGIISGVSMYFYTGGIGKALGIGFAFMQAVFQLVYIFPAIASTIWYLSLVEQKEGVGIMERIAALGEAETGEDPDPGYSEDFDEHG
ncbi:MAG: hypothetical protein INR69_12510 [Mucilaginibacter polytrichastri]|nr:hypothetical protein [Mucilaginibacter polytrichastri]